MNVPRYKSSSPLQKQFVTNADGRGDMIFTQVRRSGNVAIYSRHYEGSPVKEWEVITIKTVKAGAKLPGNNVVANDYEPYPGGQSFGKGNNGYSCVSLARAEEIFNRIVKENSQVYVAPTTTSVVKPVVDEASEIPAGEFTQVQFATHNCMPPRGAVYNVLQGLIVGGKVKESRRVSMGPGRPTILYVGC